ncbi:MAG: hypothetical protein ABIC19_01160 [Patescibacteria group bacterium]|nr:pilin [Patescibacteria group bacterium]
MKQKTKSWKLNNFTSLRIKKILAGICVLAAAAILFLFSSHETLANLEDPLKLEGDSPSQLAVEIIGRILEIIYKSVIGLALVFIIIGGIMYMLSTGNEQRMNLAKSIVIYAVVGIAIAIGSAVIMNGIATALGGEISNTFEPIPGVMTDTLSAKTILGKVINLLLQMLGMLGIIGIVIGGLWFLNSSGNEDRMLTGKKTLIYSVIGLVIALGSMIIIKQLENLFISN